MIFRVACIPVGAKRNRAALVGISSYPPKAFLAIALFAQSIDRSGRVNEKVKFLIEKRLDRN